LSGDLVERCLHPGRSRGGLDHRSEHRLNLLRGLLLHLDQVLVIAVHFVGQVVLGLELGDGEGGVDCGRREVAPRIPQEAEAKTSSPFGTEAGLHLDPMSKEILAQVANGLVAGNGGCDGRIERLREVSGLKLRGGDLRQGCVAVLVARDLDQPSFLFKPAADPLGGEPVTTSVDPFSIEINGGRSDVEVLLPRVEVLHRTEWAVAVAEARQGLLDFMNGLIP